MAVRMEHNHCGDSLDDTCYIPTSVDSSIPLILAHRGVPASRIAKLIVDLDSSCTLAAVELTELLPCSDRQGYGQGYEHVFDVYLGRNGRWNGRRLSVRMTLPESVREALIGKGLRTAVDHPALPDRPILRIDEEGQNLVFHVRADPQPVVSLSGASDAVIAGSPERNRLRRVWINSHFGEYHSESDWTWLLDGIRGKAIEDLMNGVVRTYGDRCWGEPEPATPAHLVTTARTGFRFLSGWLGALFGRGSPEDGGPGMRLRIPEGRTA